MRWFDICGVKQLRCWWVDVSKSNQIDVAVVVVIVVVRRAAPRTTMQVLQPELVQLIQCDDDNNGPNCVLTRRRVNDHLPLELYGDNDSSRTFFKKTDI